MWECRKFSVLARVTNYIYQRSYEYGGSVTRKLDLFYASVWLVCNHVIVMTPPESRKRGRTSTLGMGSLYFASFKASFCLCFGIIPLGFHYKKMIVVVVL